MSESEEDHQSFPFENIIMSVEYLIIVLLCIIKTAEIVKNRHNFFGFQNLMIVISLCWCIFRELDLLISTFFQVFSGKSDEHAGYLIKDIPSFVMVGLLSYLCYYYFSLIHKTASKCFSVGFIVFLIVFNICHISSLFIVDMMLMFSDSSTSVLTVCTMCFSAVCYIVILIMLVIVSIQIRFVDPHDFDQSHPRPISMMIAGGIICLCVLTRIIYDIASAAVGDSVINKMCNTQHPMGFCDDKKATEIVVMIVVVVLMTLWEIVPLICLIVCFWKIPKKQEYFKFEGLFEQSEREEGYRYEYDTLRNEEN